MNEALNEIVSSLKALKEESDISRRVKEKADQIILLLNSDNQMAVEKALLELEEINSMDLSSYHRTQVWAVISLLESLKN